MTAFTGPFDAGGYAHRVDPAELQLAQTAAKAFIDSCDNKEALRNETVAKTALSQIVQDLLCLAMIDYIKTLPHYKQQLYAHLCCRHTFGIAGACWQVSPVFGYLLNSIHGRRVTRCDHFEDHAMLVTVASHGTGKPLYIDATWRQGGDKRPRRTPSQPDPREKLPMVRVSADKPTLSSLDQAVTDALRKKTLQS